MSAGIWDTEDDLRAKPLPSGFDANRGRTSPKSGKRLLDSREVVFVEILKAINEGRNQIERGEFETMEQLT